MVDQFGRMLCHQCEGPMYETRVIRDGQPLCTVRLRNLLRHRIELCPGIGAARGDPSPMMEL